MIESIVNILAGLIAISGFFIARFPNGKKLVDQLTPYQGGFGIALFLWGAWLTVGVILSLGILSFIEIGLNWAFIMWVIVVLIAFVDIALGFLLGFGMIAKFAFAKNEQALQKGLKIRNTLLKIQTPLGFVSIGTGVFALVASFGFPLVGAIAGGVFVLAYVALLIIMGNPKSDAVNDKTETTSNKKQTPANVTVSKNGPFYETRVTNVTCVPEGTSFKVGLRITAKKFLIDAAGKEKEVMINNDIQIGMMKDGKEIYLKNYKFTKPITSLSLVLSQKPDKIGIDPYNLLPEKPQLN